MIDLAHTPILPTHTFGAFAKSTITRMANDCLSSYAEVRKEQKDMLENSQITDELCLHKIRHHPLCLCTREVDLVRAVSTMSQLADGPTLTIDASFFIAVDVLHARAASWNAFVSNLRKDLATG